MFVLVLCASCSSSGDNRPRSAAGDGTDPAARLGQAKINFRNPEMAALYQAAKAAPRTFEPVYAYTKAVTDAALASLADKSCEGCVEGAVKYRPRSELEPQHWPIIEDALSMLEALGKVQGLTAEETDQLLATKGRLLWLAGRSNEEQNMIDDYARTHPTAVAVIRRRLELLRENSEAATLEAQCTRSRAKTESLPEAARVDLLTACVAFHLDNTEGRSDVVDYARYLPNLTPAEDALYRAHLVQRCEAKVGTEETRCADACACEDNDAGKSPTAKCKKACGGCRSDTEKKLRICKKVGEAPPVAVARPAKEKAASAPRAKSTAPAAAARPKTGSPAPRAKGNDSGLKPVEL